MIEVLSSGGGTQSTAICALIIQGRLPKPDYIVIADTGREMPTTWTYLDAIVRPALRTIGLEVHRISQGQYGSKWAQGIFSPGKGTLLIPAFSNRSGNPSKLSQFCTKGWKIEVVDRFLSKKCGITRSRYRKWIGFSMDEPKRVLPMQQGEEYKKGLIYLPLVDLRIRRADAIALVEKMGWPKPPRSRCYMCPNQSDYEWAEVKNDHPDRWEQSVALDESIRERDPRAFLHSSIKPLRDAQFDQQDDLFSGSCPSGECFT